jgi:hypothetical protein
MHQFTNLWIARRSFSGRKCKVRLLFFINDKEQEVRGIEISANHRSIREGVYWYTNYSQRKNAASVGNKIMMKEFDFALS